MLERMEDGLDIACDARAEKIKERGLLTEFGDPRRQILVDAPGQLWDARTQFSGDPGELSHHLGSDMCGTGPVAGRPRRRGDHRRRLARTVIRGEGFVEST